MARSLRFYGNGVSFWVASGQSSLAHSLTQGLSWWRVPLSQDGFQREGVSEVGRLLPLLAPPEFSRLVFRGSTMFLIGTSCETTQASGFHRAWPRWVVSVHSSLTTIHMWICVWTFWSICLFAYPVPITTQSNYYNFIIGLDIWWFKSL